MLYIIVKRGDSIVRSFPFEKERIVIGRSGECDLILNDPLVSRKHCVLKREGDNIFIEDAKSKNGTFLNGKKIQVSKVEIGDEIGVGFFRIELRELEEMPDERTKELKRGLPESELKELEIYLYRDALTGVYSRKFFEDEIKGWGKETFPLSILFLDIDDFKKINDFYGHRMGDIVLNALGDFLVRNYFNSYPLRWGGEEFLIFLKNTDLEKAKEIAENLRENFLKFIKARIGLHITISIGISSIPENAFSIDEAIEKADRAMYRAKFEGKNRVAIYENR